MKAVVVTISPNRVAESVEGAAPLCVMPLPAQGLLLAEGADTDVFLQGQLSSDLRQLQSTAGQLSSFSSPKGRLLAVLYLNRFLGGVCLEVHQSMLEATLQRLRRYILRSKVRLGSVSEQWPALGVSGSAAAERLQALGHATPEAIDGFQASQDLYISRRRGAFPRFLLRGSAASLDALLAELRSTAQVAEPSLWRRQDIEAGLPCIYPETAEHFVAQMANLDLLGGISFDKGCYTGQEVIARLHYLGSVKRRMAVLRLEAAAAPGAPLFDAAHPEQPVGEIADVAPLGEQGWLAAAVVQAPYLRSAGLHVGAADGPESGPLSPAPGIDSDT